jgi:tRNA(Ile)-lysidine synthase
MQLMPRSGRSRNPSVLAVKPRETFSVQDRELFFAAIKNERHVALAVSGGSDSMAMLRLAASWPRDRIRLSVLTVDHGLRIGSAHEAWQVAAWCTGLSLPHEVLRWQGEKPVTGLQAKARMARYDLMTDWCTRNDVGWLLTAHTQDDQAETVLMRQARTRTDESLAGIWAIGEWRGIKLFRPLLDERRLDLRNYLRSLGQEWIEDPSNVDEKYERVRVRQALANDSVRTKDLAHVASLAHQAASRLKTSADDWIANNLTEFPEGYGTVPHAVFAALENDLQRRLFSRLVGMFGAATSVSPDELQRLSAWISGTGNSRRTLGGAIIAKRKNEIVFGREAGRIPATPVIVPISGEAVWDGRFMVQAPPQSRILPLWSFKIALRQKHLPAFVQAGLPAVLVENGPPIVPHLGIGRGATAKFIRCLR